MSQIANHLIKNQTLKKECIPLRKENSNTSVKLQHKCKFRRGFSNYEDTRRQPTVLRGILNLVEFHPKASQYSQR